MKKLTADEKHDFIADVTAHLLARIDAGAEVFAVLEFRHDKERDTMHCTHSTVRVSPDPSDDRMADRVEEIVADFMDAHARRWAQ